MLATLVAYTQQNPVLDPYQLEGQGDLSTIWNGLGTFPEQLIEYAGRVCYKSTHRMGTSPSFISARVREGHEDIIEHVVATVRFRGDNGPAQWRLLNRHCEATQLADHDWLISGNTRVWLHLFRQSVGLEALPFLYSISPAVFDQYADEVEAIDVASIEIDTGVVAVGPLTADGTGLAALMPAHDDPMRVTMLGYTQPIFADPAIALHHGSATFLFEGVSRTCTHQLVRHRLASFSQESQRYVDMEKGGWNAIVPDAILANPEALEEMEAFWTDAEQKYRRLRELGIRKEDARFLLPNAAETRIVTTMNFASWSHFLWLRALDKASQWEIRRMGQHVLKMLHAIAPDVFADHWEVYQTKFSG